MLLPVFVSAYKTFLIFFLSFYFAITKLFDVLLIHFDIFYNIFLSFVLCAGGLFQCCLFCLRRRFAIDR